MPVAALYGKAVRAHQRGEEAAAGALYREILANYPDHSDAAHMLGVIAMRAGQREEALKLFQHAVSIAPANAQFCNNLGVALRSLGRREEAVATFRKAVSIDEGSSDAHTNLGNALLAGGDTIGAISAYTDALTIDPVGVPPRNGLAAAYRQAGNLPRAIALYAELVRELPSNITALNNLGVVKMEAGDHEGATSCYYEALKRDPNSLETLNNVSVLSLARGDARQAVSVLRRALQLDPNSTTALGNLGNALRRQGRVGEAEDCYRNALSIAPNDGLRVRLATLLPVIAGSTEELTSARRNVEASVDALLSDDIHIDDPISEVGATNFHLSYHDSNNRRLNVKIAQLFSHACPTLNFIAPHCLREEQSRGRRVKIGFISRNLRDHAVGWCYHRLIRNLPKGSFEVLAITFDGKDDAVWGAISDSVDKAIVVPSNLRSAQEAVAREELDVLIYTDIGLDPTTYFLSFARLAPIQCVTNGHPDTTGVPTLDYFVSSGPLEESDARSHYSETLVALDDVLVDYERPAAPATRRGREAYGLAEDRTLYLCPQSLFKIHPEMDEALYNILEADKNGQLVVFAGADAHWTDLLLQRWQGVFGEKINKIIVLERKSYTEFLDILGHADVILDSWPFCGGNTAYQTFAMGRPIVTLPGRFARGRSTSALYRKMEITDLIAKSPENYVELAVKLGTQEAWRENISARIAARSDRLFGDQGAVDAFADFLHGISRQREAVA